VNQCGGLAQLKTIFMERVRERRFKRARRLVAKSDASRAITISDCYSNTTIRIGCAISKNPMPSKVKRNTAPGLSIPDDSRQLWSAGYSPDRNPG
jgi:hypothetical protein